MPLSLLKRVHRRLFGKRAPAPSPGEPAPPPAAPDGSPPVQEGQGRRRRRRPRRRSVRGEPSSAGPRPPEPPATVWSPEQFVVPPQAGQVRFHDLPLREEVLHAICGLEFRYCTPVQAKVLPHALRGRSVTGRAQTGTGKTAAFLIAILDRFLRNPLESRGSATAPRALIIAPTRELVVQIAKDASDLARYCPISVLAVYGGTDFVKQRDALHRQPIDLLVATPGRLLDFKNREGLDLGRVEVLVIDEADRMLDMGFIPDVKRIVRALPGRHARQTMMFSATLTQDVLRLASEWIEDPVVVEVEPEQVAVETVEQIVYAVAARDKFRLLYNLLREPGMDRVLVFGNRRDRTMRLAGELRRHGVGCSLLSGSVPQTARLRVLGDFREGKIRVLVATDVAGRGIHVEGITHVVNYDFPYEADDYVHRIGRTGRAGRAGTAISFACEDESFIIPDIEAYIGNPLKCSVPEDRLLAPPPRPTHEHSPAPEGAGYRHEGRPTHAGHGSRGSRGRRAPAHGRPSADRAHRPRVSQAPLPAPAPASPGGAADWVPRRPPPQKA